jgi:hypothetical protein
MHRAMAEHVESRRSTLVPPPLILAALYRGKPVSREDPGSGRGGGDDQWRGWDRCAKAEQE